jgi:uncharacterized protein
MSQHPEHRRHALLVYGGWEGHTPQQSIERFVPFLESQGFEVTLSNDLASYADAALMSRQDLIVQCVTMANITPEQWQGLNAAVRGGCGLAGWHGGLCDSFRATASPTTWTSATRLTR